MPKRNSGQNKLEPQRLDAVQRKIQPWVLVVGFHRDSTPLVQSLISLAHAAYALLKKNPGKKKENMQSTTA